MSSNPIKANHNAVNFLWKQNIRTPKEISNKTGIPLRTCQRYVTILKKNGKIPEIHRSGRPRKLSSEKRRQLGMIVKSNHYRTATEMKAILEEKYQDLEV
ncbi:6836_t:CDS:1, partial [Entrophospora sp. SA101]